MQQKKETSVLVFVVDENSEDCQLVAYALKNEPNTEVHAFQNAEACLDQLHLLPSAVIVSKDLSSMAVNELISKIKNYNQEIAVACIGSIQTVKKNTEIISSSQTYRDPVAVKAEQAITALKYLKSKKNFQVKIADAKKEMMGLAHYFIQQYCLQNDIPETKLSSEAILKLNSFLRPENAYELKYVIEKAVKKANGAIIKASDIATPGSDILPDILEEELTLKEYDYKIISYYLKKYNNNIKLVAEKLDIGQSSIYRFLKDERFPVMS